MSDVRAGVAYVDIRLGAVEDFKSKLKKEVEGAVAEVGKRVGDDLAKSATPGASKAGKVTSAAMSKAFFADAGKSFTGGFRALSDFNIKLFGKMMFQAGTAGALGIKTALEAGVRGFLPTTKNLLTKGLTGLGTALATTGSYIAGKFMAGLKAIPGALKTASAAISSFSRNIGLLGFQMTNFGFIATTAFTAPVAAILTLGTVIGINTASKIEQATAALKALTPAGTNVEALVKRLQNLAQRSPIFSTVDVVTFTQKMVAAGLTVKQTEDFLNSFGNIALTVGADVSKIPFALEALVQMVGKGTVSMEELRQQLGDALPGAMTIVAQSLHVTQAELFDMVKAGDLTAKDLIAAMTKIGKSGKYLKGAQKGAETLTAKWQQLKETVANQLGQIFLDNSSEIKKGIDDLGPSLKNLINISKPLFVDLIKGFKGFVDWIAKAIKWYQELTPENQKLFKTLSIIAIVLGPIAIAFGALASALAGITALVSFLISPVGLAVIGILALAAGITWLVKWMQNAYKEGGKFREIWDKIWDSVATLFKNLKPVIQDLWNDIKDAWAQLSKTFSDNKDELKLLLMLLATVAGVILAVVVGVLFGALKGIIAALGPVIKAIASFVSGLIKILGGANDFVSGVFTLNWSRAWMGIQKIWDGLWDAIVGVLVNAVQAVWNLVKGLVTGIGDFFYWLYNLLVGHSIVPDMVNAILAWFSTLVNKGRSILNGIGNYFRAFYSSYVAPMVNSIKSGINNVISIISSLSSKVKSALSSAGSWLVSVGKNMIQGLIDGIGQMIGPLANKAANAAKAGLDAAKHALGIHSPSTEFKKVGKFVVQGFMLGVDSLTPKMLTQMSSFSDIIPERTMMNVGSNEQPISGARTNGAALNIENYYANENADPKRQAEDWYFIVSSRGGNA